MIKSIFTFLSLLLLAVQTQAQTVTIVTPNGGESWQAGSTQSINWITSGTVSYVSVYYSTDNAATFLPVAEFVANNGSLNWDIPAGISSSQCKVAVFNALDDSNFDLSDATFTVSAAAGSLSLTSPNGGEYLTGGNTYTVKWSAPGVDNINLSYSKDGGVSWVKIQDNLDASSGIYDWTVPYVNSSSCLIRIANSSDTTQKDISASLFNISGSYVLLTAPNGGESLTGASSYNISWSYSGSNNYVNLYYSTDNGSSWVTIGTYIYKNNGYYTWSVPNVNSSNVTIKIEDSYNSQILDVSDAPFSITASPASLFIISPNGGQLYATGSTVSIQWSSTNISQVTGGTQGGVNLYYSSDNGTTWTLFKQNNTSNNGTNSYSWVVPSVVSTSYLIKIENAENPSLYDISNAPFTVVAPGIQITSPNGGQDITGGNVYTITYNSIGLSNYVNLYYSLDGGANWTYINYANNTGSYNWNVPVMASSSALIKVEDYSTPSIMDISDAVFTISAPPSSITVYSPNGGEQFVQGQNKTISWSSSSVNNVDIYYSVDNGSTWLSIATNINATNYSYNWYVPNELSNTCLVKIISSTDNAVSDVSNATFSILEPTLTVISPNGGEVYRGGSSQTIYINNSGGYRYGDIDISTDGGTTWTTLYNSAGFSAQGNSSYTINLPNVSSTTCKVRVSDDSNPSVFDLSDGNFTLNYSIPEITITTPNSLVNWISGQSQNIIWNSINLTGVNLYYSADSGSTWTVIASGVSSTTGQSNYYYWNIPTGINSTKCLIKIEDASNAAYYDITNTDFNIKAPSIAVVTPNGDESLQTGTTYRVKWNSEGISQYVTLEYRLSPTGSWTTIVSGISDNEYYDWTVPNSVSSTVKIRVSDYYNSSTSDQSDYNFKIVNPTSTSLAVSTPAQSTIWNVNSTQYIYWNTTGTIANVKLEYNLNGSNPTGWITITNSTPNNNYYAWTLPSTPSNTVRVRVSDATNASVAGVSDNFVISQPFINVTAPNGGESWTAGTQEYVEWNSIGLASSYVNIYYSTDGGSNWNYFTQTYNYGYFYWTIPTSLAATNCLKIKVADASNSSLFDESDVCVNLLAATPTLTLSTPNNGESWSAGSQQYIYFSTVNVSAIDIDYSTNNGTSWSSVATNVSTANGYYFWTVPSVNSSLCKVRIKDVASSAQDISNSVFKIYQSTVSLVSPNGGEAYNPGTVVPVQWYSNSLNSNYAYLYYSVDSGANWVYYAGTNSYDNQINTYNWTVPNNPSTRCLFKVADYNNASVFDVSDAKFTINPPQPAITLSSPNGGEQWVKGTQYSITWTSQSVANVNIDYTTDNGSSWTSIAANVSSTGSYNWVPAFTSPNVKIRITSAIDANVFDISSAPFTITQPNVYVISPNGAETLIAGNSYSLQWYSEGLSNYVNLYYSIDSGSTWNLISSPYNYNASVNTYNWSVANVVSSKCYFKVADYYTASIKDSSDNDFIIVAPQPYVTVTSPNGGEVWGTGNNYAITWSSAGVSAFDLKYSIDNGQTWTTIVTNATGSTYNWSVPTTLQNTPYNLCRIQVSASSNASVSDVSNLPFTITDPGITVIAPNGGESYMATTYLPIKWQAVGTSQYAYLYYSLDSGVTFTNITSVSQNIGSVNTYSWYIPNTSSTKAVIRVADYNNQAIKDESDQVFVINPTTPYITVSTPNGGQTWLAGNSYYIYYNYNNVSSVKIEYTTDNSATWNTIVSSTTANGSYYWTVPGTIGNSCQAKIRITDVSNSSLFDVSDNTFCVGVPVITVTSPNGGEQWQGGATATVTWTSMNISSYVNVMLSVNGGTSYDYSYFATNSGSYSFAVPNSPSSNCLVKIRDYYNANTYDVSNATFSISPAPPTITVNRPTAGNEFIVGTTEKIYWNAVSVTDVKIEYSSNNGGSWNTVVASTPANAGVYNWTVPNDVSSQCLVRISDVANSNVSDVSDLFYIRYPFIIVNAPNGNESWSIGSSRNITWSSAGVSSVKLEYSINGGVSWSLIATGVSSAYYVWTVPNTPSTQCKVKVTSVTDSTVFDLSNNVFSIPNPSVTLTSPNGGETFSVGTSRYIYWTSQGLNNLKLEYSTDGGSSWNTIISSVAANLGYYNWMVPNAPSQNCLVKVSDANNAAITDVSNANFTILYPVITITSPNGGEQWSALSYRNITWNSTGIGSYVKIEYSTNGGSVYNLISSSEYNDGSYSWYLPNITANSVMLKISDASVTSINDVSDNYFSISAPVPAISITSPNGGENWNVGSSYSINWTSTALNNVKIEYTFDAGNTWNTVVASVASNNGNNSYAWTVPNTPNQKCKIRISSVANANVVDFSDNFFTIPIPSISITSPNGGEVWGSPSQRYIYWSSVSVQNVRIEYTTNGTVWNTLTPSYPASYGYYVWNIPSNINSTNARVRVSSTLTSAIKDESNAVFTITQPSITLASPNGGETFGAYTYRNITWNSNGLSSYVKLDYSTDGGSTWNAIVSYANNNGSYNWYVPNVASSNCKVRVSDYYNSSISDVSNTVFTIQQATPSVTVTSPNGGEQWLTSSYYYIYWTATSLQTVKIEYSINNGANWNLISNNTNASQGYYYWYVSDLISPTSQALIRVSDANNNSVSDVSNAVFSISKPVPAIAVTSPNGGENWLTNSYHYITWNTVAVSNVNIEFSNDGGANYQTLATGINASTGYYYYYTPATSSTTCLIRITDAANNILSDVSNSVFTISAPVVNNNTLSTDSVGTKFCKGDSIHIGYHATGVYNNGNRFAAQLSDASGNFNNPIEIGSIYSTALTGTISGYLPTYITNGNNYRVRVVSNDLPATGTDNGDSIKINSPQFDFTANSLVKYLPDGTVDFTFIPDGDATGYTYTWDFGDGTNSSLEEPQHDYYNPGFYTVSLNVTSSSGCEAKVEYFNYIRVEQIFPTIPIPPSSGNNLNGVSMADNFNGCAVGENGTVNVTTDGGVTWNTVSANGLPQTSLTSVHMIDNNNIVTVGADGNVYYSSNGGSDWTVVTIANGNGNSLLSVTFKDGTDGVAVGAAGTVVTLTYTPGTGVEGNRVATNITGDCNGVVDNGSFKGCVASDGSIHKKGGSGWSQVYNSEGDPALNSIAFYNSDFGLAVGNNGTIVRSTDGDNWTKVYNGLTSNFKSVQIDGYAHAYVFGDDGVVYLSEDTGQTWVRYSIGNTTNLKSSKVKDPKGVIVGAAGSGFRFGGNDIGIGALDTVYCAGQEISVEYFVAGRFNQGNVFRVEMSDANGDFTMPVVLGSTTNTGAGFITAQIPQETASGTKYRFRVVSTDSVVASPDNGSDIAIHAAPVVSLGNDTSICSGNTLTLDAGNNGSSYLWNNQSNAQTLTVDTTGGYTVLVTGANGCTAKDSVHVELIETLAVNLGADVVSCANNTVELVANVVGATYSWNTGATTQSISVSASGTYSVTVNVCSQSSTDSVSVDLSATIGIATVSVANTGMTAGGISGSVTYQWYEGQYAGAGNLIANATTQTYLPQDSGWFYVMVTNAAGCYSYSSPVFFSSVGLTEYAQNAYGLMVYPNPTQGKLTIEMHGEAKEASLYIETMIGQRVQEQNVQLVGGSAVQTLDLSALPAGVYFVKAINGKENYVQRVVVQH